jgi:endonuclease/exonuclease/phosphatase family metal-dependent hydrolase
MSHQTIRITTFNIHKGVGTFNSQLVLHEQRELIRRLHSDIVFLQEVRGDHIRHQPTHAIQHEFLADNVWPEFAYGKNAIYPDGHHGNAILSKFPISQWTNEDISAHPTEQRGMLHCEVEIPGWDQPLHCLCVHLGLFSRWRKRQLLAVRHRIETLVPKDAPLIIAGDFNDWRSKAGGILHDGHLKEVFEHTAGRPAKSFPALLPMFRLDRIYTRGFHIQQTQVHHGKAGAKMSDHAALSAILTRT